MLRNISKVLTEALSCCRGTSEENLYAKLDDILSYANFFSQEQDLSFLLDFCIKDPKHIKVFCLNTEELLGSLIFLPGSTEVQVYLQDNFEVSHLLGCFNSHRSSKFIARSLTSFLAEHVKKVQS